MSDKKELTHVVVNCCKCGNSLDLGEMFLYGSTEGEQWDALERILPASRWAVSKGISNNRQAICPVCQQKIQFAQSSNAGLKEFKATENCPKCGGHNITLKYCQGLTSDCFGVVSEKVRNVEHLHHECKTCSFVWLTKTKDQHERKSRNADNGCGKRRKGVAASDTSTPQLFEPFPGIERSSDPQGSRTGIESVESLPKGSAGANRRLEGLIGATV
jgi:hypothetical protein